MQSSRIQKERRQIQGLDRPIQTGIRFTYRNNPGPGDDNSPEAVLQIEEVIVDYEIIRDVVVNKIPGLREQMESILNEKFSGGDSGDSRVVDHSCAAIRDPSMARTHWNTISARLR